jgi:quinol monooxygenase YgiN
LGEPIVFVSHLRVRPGKLADVRALATRIVEEIKTAKPQTEAFLAYLSDDGLEMTIVHMFADAEAMDLHFGGADERSTPAYEVLEQVGWEVYGQPSDDANATLQTGAAATGARLTLAPEWLGGFIRAGSRTPR